MWIRISFTPQLPSHTVRVCASSSPVTAWRSSSYASSASRSTFSLSPMAASSAMDALLLWPLRPRSRLVVKFGVGGKLQTADDRLRKGGGRLGSGAEGEAGLVHLDLHDEETGGGLDAVHPRVERPERHPLNGAAGRRDDARGRVRAPGGPPVARMDAEVSGSGELEHRGGQDLFDEEERPLPARPDLRQEGLHDGRPPDSTAVERSLHMPIALGDVRPREAGDEADAGCGHVRAVCHRGGTE